MKKGARKLILSGCMLFATAISLVSTTFAFVTLQKEANVSEFGFSIENQEGLLISLDGKNFYQDLSYSQITKAIEAYANAGLESTDPNYVPYDKLTYSGVTLNSTDLAGETVKGVKFNSYKYKLGGEGAEISDFKASFLKDTLVPGTDPSGENDIYWEHSFVEADSKDYVYFDLWFKVATNGSEKSKYNLKFTDRTEITGTDSVVKVQTGLTTTGIEDSRSGDRPQLAPTDPIVPYVRGQYLANDEITVNPANAMRLAVVMPKSTSVEDQANPRDAFINVYEPNLGLGSVAVEGMVAAPTDYDAANYSEDSHYAYSYDLANDYNPYLDPAKNAMYTNNNLTHPLSPFANALEMHEGIKTRKYFTSDVLGTFDGTTGEYATIKLSIAIWLEGWDADYLMGVSTSDLKVKLGFEIVEA